METNVEKEYPVYLTAEQRAKVRDALDRACIDKGDQSAIELADKFAPIDPYWRKLTDVEQNVLRALVGEDQMDYCPSVEEILDTMTEDEVKGYLDDETLGESPE